jgi:hypothetical protein
MCVCIYIYMYVCVCIVLGGGKTQIGYKKGSHFGRENQNSKKTKLHDCMLYWSTS